MSSAASSQPILDPETLDGIRDLHLVARAVVEGFLAGLHLDARTGVGIEPSSFRAYQPGDDPRRIDWKAWARSDRYVVRESEREREVTLRLLVDVSASMAHRDDAGKKEVVKFDIARRLAAALAYLVDAQGDAVVLHLLGQGISPEGVRGRPAQQLKLCVVSLSAVVGCLDR